MHPDPSLPLDALRTLEYCVRHNSFEAAASDLGISAHAVNQQIHALETLLGRKLFTQNGGQSEPSDAAAILARYVREGLNSFATGIQAVSPSENHTTLIVNAAPYFAHRFLQPRLDQFKKENPDVDLRLTNQPETISFADTNVSLSIQHGYEDWRESVWSDYQVQRIATDHKIICCSSSLMKGDYPVLTAAALCGYPLLQTTNNRRLWQSVLSHLDIDHPDADGGASFPDMASLHEATAQGLGIGLVSKTDALEGISSGRLVAPLGEDAIADMAESLIPGFYLVYPKQNPQSPQARAFCEWLDTQNWYDPQSAQ